MAVVVYDLEDPEEALLPAQREQLGSYFRGRLAERPWFTVVLDNRVSDRLREEKAAASGPARDDSQPLELGRTRNPTHAVHTELLRFDDGCAISTALFDLETEARLDSHTERVPCEADAQRDALDRIAMQLGRPKLFAVGGKWSVTANTVLGQDHYEITLVSTGGSVHGTGNHGERWEGHLQGQVLKAVWTKGGFAGRLRLTFSSDGKHCVGSYGFGEDDDAFALQGFVMAEP